MIVCDACIKDIKKAIATVPHPPHLWFRYIWTIPIQSYMYKKEYAQEFTDFLNPDIKFTTEGEEEGALAFLVTNSVKKDGSLKVTIYQKETHTD